MKIALIIFTIAIFGYGTGLFLEVLAEGDDSKLQRLADTGKFDPQWIPFLLKGDLYNKVNDLLGTASAEYLDVPRFVQIGQMSVTTGPVIEHANVAIDIEVIPVIIDDKALLQNVVNVCYFHSPESFFPLCVICEILDEAGNIIGEGVLSDPEIGYSESSRLEIPLTSVPEQEPGVLIANDVQEVDGARIKICRFNEGCTPGFWRTHSVFGPAAFNAWPTAPNFSEGDPYLVVFDIVAEAALADFKIKVEKVLISDPTLFEATQAEGGYFNAFARHSTAALLNADSPLVDYALTVDEVKMLVKNLAVNGDLTDRQAVEALKDFFEAQNELFCGIGADSQGVEPNPEFEGEPEEDGDGGGKGGGKKK